MHQCTGEKITHIISIYGISQNPHTKEYIMVMEYMDKGDMRHYLRKHSADLDWNRRLRIVLEIATGLTNIHANELIHRDFHSGNLLFEYTLGDTAFIGDLGLCCQTNSGTEKEIYGVVPYVAPEIFNSK